MIHSALLCTIVFPIAFASSYSQDELIQLIANVQSNISAQSYCANIDANELDEYPSWISKHMDSYSKLELIVGDQNAVLQSLENDACYYDNVVPCFPKLSLHSSFRIAATAVFAGLIGLIWLLILAPCACCRCMRCCKARSPRNLTTCEWFSIVVLSIGAIGGLFVTVAYTSIYRDHLNRGISYGLCGASNSATGLMNVLNLNSIDIYGAVIALEQSYDVGDQTLGQALKIYANQLHIVNGFIKELLISINSTLNQIPSQLPRGYIMPLAQSIVTNQSEGFNIVYDSIAPGNFSANATVLGDFMVQTSSIVPLAYTISEYAGVFATSLEATLVKYHDQIVTAQNWIRRGSLAMFILIFFPVLSLFLSVCVYARKSRSLTLSDPTIRPYQSSGSLIAWCVTITYAFLTISIAAAVFATAYFTSASCLVARDLSIEAPNLKHLYNNEFSSISTSNWASLVTQITEPIECAFPPATSAIDPATNNTVFNSIVDMYNILENAFSVTVNPNELPYGVLYVVSSFVEEGSIYTTTTNLSDFPDVFNSSFDRNFTAYISQLNADSLYNMTEVEYDTLYNLTWGSVASCDNITFSNMSDMGPFSAYDYSYQNLSEIGEKLGWSNNTAPGLNHTIELAKAFKVFPDNFTCEGFWNMTGSDFDAAVPKFEPFTAFLKSKTDLIQSDGYSCLSMGYIGDFFEAGNVTFNISTYNCTFKEMQIMTALSIPLDVLMTSYLGAMSWYMTATILQQSGSIPNNIAFKHAYQHLQNIIDEQRIQPEVFTELSVMLDATCQTAAPAYLMLGVGLFIFGVCSLFALIAQFIIWRRIIDNYSLWADTSTRGRA